MFVDWSGASVTPWGLASQIRPRNAVRRLIGRPQESTLAQRKSTPSYGDEPNLCPTAIILLLFGFLNTLKNGKALSPCRLPIICTIPQAQPSYSAVQ